MAEEQIKTFLVESDGERLDLFLLNNFVDDLEFSNITRSQLKNWIVEGRVKVNGKELRKQGVTLRVGQSVEVTVPTPEGPNAEPIEMPLDIIYEDEYFLVLNKPANLSVHPGAGQPVTTLVNGLAWHFKDIEIPPRCGIVHRLDKDTTGAVVVAKNVETQSLLAKLFAERKIKKTYLALVFTTPRARRIVQVEESGVIETRMGRHPNNWRMMSVLPSGGKEAITCWHRIESMPYATLLEIGLKTGRTHQIRVHMDYIRCPIIGDQLYGDTSSLPLELKRTADSFGRQALHAKQLEFVHPITGKEMKFEADLPADFEELINTFRSYQS